MHIGEAFSQPLSLFLISSFKNNYCKWFYNMQSTFRHALPDLEGIPSTLVAKIASKIVSP
jgi:hypothetical protein